MISRARFSKRALPYLLLAPAFLLLTAIIIYPLGYSVYLSFTNANLLRFGQHAYVGVSNYVRYLGRADFWHSILVTLEYTAGTVVLAFFMGMVTALLLNVEFPLRGIARGLIAIPWATPWLVVTLVWYILFNPQAGPINVALERLGIIQNGIPWLYQRSTALIAIIVVTAWRLFPSATLLILAGLQSIASELYDAARVDRATRWQQFRYVTLPNLKSVNLVVLVLLVIWTFKLFTIAFALTSGGPGNATNVLSVFTYQVAFMSNLIGRASALSVLSVLMSLVLVAVYFVVLPREDKASM